MNARALADYAAYFERVAPETLDELPALLAADARFRDPFNDARGLEAIRRVFERMFETCAEVRFRVHDQALSAAAGYLLWTMTFRPRARGMGRRPWRIEGMSRVRFDAAGKIVEHIDYWDAGSQFYARLPLLGGLIRWIARRV